MAKGWYEKPKGLGTDNMSCCILRFKQGHADDAATRERTWWRLHHWEGSNRNGVRSAALGACKSRLPAQSLRL